MPTVGVRDILSKCHCIEASLLIKLNSVQQINTEFTNANPKRKNESLDQITGKISNILEIKSKKN